MLLALTVAACCAVLVVVHVGTMAVTGWAMGAKPTRVSFFAGPRLFTHLVGGVQVELGVVPFGGFVTFGPPESGLEGLLALPRLAELAVLLSGNAALIALGLGLGAPLEALGADVVQCLTALRFSFAERAQWVRGWLSLLQPRPFEALGRLALVFAVFNLLPIAPMNGGRALELVVGLALRRPRSWSFPRWVQPLGLLVTFALFGVWLAALGMAVFSAR